LRVFCCRICGSSYVGTRRPSHCPFCGAHEKFMVSASEWSSPGSPELSEETRKVLERALEMEVSKAAFYACAAEEAGQEKGQALFASLSLTHGKHGAIIRDLLGLAKPKSSGQGTCHETVEENLKEASGRQEDAVAFYQDAREGAAEPRVKEVCQALLEIEGDHLTLVQRFLADSRD
jgi:rubrerythrin